MLDDSIVKVFDRIYSTDLVYLKDCWRLCRDAHCCSFSRYKAKFKLIVQKPFQELPLLPGEYEYLQDRGWLGQFGDFDHKVINYAIGERNMRIESIISPRPNCACNHDTRPTVCRLYPLLPVFDIDGRVIGIDSFGIYEELEKIEGLEPACKLTALPFVELQKFLTISSEIGRHPNSLYYLTAYRITKEHVGLHLAAVKRASLGDCFSLFERAFIRNQLINYSELKAQLVSLAFRFEERYGACFQL